jgi:hypothetical protein
MVNKPNRATADLSRNSEFDFHSWKHRKNKLHKQEVMMHDDLENRINRHESFILVAIVSASGK